MRARFSQFKAVQARYVQLKALTGTDSKPMVFNFDGEYSVVADPAGGSVDSVVNTVIRDVQAALELRFQCVVSHPCLVPDHAIHLVHLRSTTFCEPDQWASSQAPRNP